MDNLDEMLLEELQEITPAISREMERAKHRKSRKGQFKSKEKTCLRGEGKNLINSQCVFRNYVRKYRRNANFWDGALYYSDNTPKYFMVDCRRQELYFYDELMRTMFVFSFSCDIYDFFIPDREVYPWEPYKEAYKEYTGEYFEETRDRVYPAKHCIIDKEILAYKNEKKYRRYKELQSASKWYEKTYKTKKLRTLEKQAFDRLKKVDDIEDYDYIFPLKVETDWVY